MPDHLRNPIKRRQSVSYCHEPESKERKMIGPMVNATDVEAIPNLCNEIIERILDCLDLQSLLNVAGTCKRLQIAAAAKYKRKFGSHAAVFYSNSYWGHGLPKWGSRFDNDVVEVFGLTAQPFLRCFGSQIAELHVKGADNHHVARYMNQYCADTLITIKIYDFGGEHFTKENFSKPFKMVEKAVIFDLGKQFSDFASWFPRMRDLLFYNERFDCDVSSAVFPDLKVLSLTAISNSETWRIERVVRANPQLRFLQIHVKKLRFPELLEMISGHKLITTLKVRNQNTDKTHVKKSLLMRFAKEHRMLVELVFFAFLLKPDDAVALICRLNLLKYFQFQLKDTADYHYLAKQLHYVYGFEFTANLIEKSKTTIVTLNIIR